MNEYQAALVRRFGELQVERVNEIIKNRWITAIEEIKMARTIPLPTMEQDKHPELVKQAEFYVVKRDNFLSANREFKTAKDDLIELMKSFGVVRYVDGESDLVIERTQKEQVKVKKLSDEEQD